MQNRLTCLLVTTIFLSLPGCGGQFFPKNDPPMIQSFRINDKDIVVGGVPVSPVPTVLANTGSSILCSATATDPNGDPITFTWLGATVVDATNSPNLAKIDNAPKGPSTITLAVKDDRGGITSLPVKVVVDDPGANHSPVAVLGAATADVVISTTLSVQATASDVDGDKLTYFFTVANSGAKIVQDATDPSKAVYTAPPTAGTDIIYCVVTDGKGAYVIAVEKITVRPM